MEEIGPPMACSMRKRTMRNTGEDEMSLMFDVHAHRTGGGGGAVAVRRQEQASARMLIEDRYRRRTGSASSGAGGEREMAKMSRK